MKKAIILTAILSAALLTSCGGTTSSTAGSSTAGGSSSAAETTTSAAGGETTAAKSSETSAAQTDESSADSRDADYAWFSTGVYTVRIDGEQTHEYYVFYDKTSGKTANAQSGIGIGFTCEQSKGKIIFHMGSDSDTSEMTMSMDASGRIVGTMNGKTYSFAMLEGVSAENFDAAAYETDVPSADETAQIEAKKAAIVNALDYVGAGYSVVSTEALPADSDKGSYFKIGICPTGQTDLTFYLYAGSHNCMTESEWQEKDASADTAFFADKRVAEINVRARVGSGYEIVSSDALPNNDNANYFKVGVRKTGTDGDLTYYYAGKSFCRTEEEWLELGAAVADDSGQNPIMNFIGNYSNGRAIMLVSGSGKNEATVKITWGSSAVQTTTWTMRGAVTTDNETQLTVDYKDCVKESYTFSADGTLTEDKTEYKDGTGKICFSFADNTAKWIDDKENAGADSVFRYITVTQ